MQINSFSSDKDIIYNRIIYFNVSSIKLIHISSLQSNMNIFHIASEHRLSPRLQLNYWITNLHAAQVSLGHKISGSYHLKYANSGFSHPSTALPVKMWKTSDKMSMIKFKTEWANDLNLHQFVHNTDMSKKRKRCPFKHRFLTANFSKPGKKNATDLMKEWLK
jgi:hypothetical protein